VEFPIATRPRATEWHVWDYSLGEYVIDGNTGGIGMVDDICYFGPMLGFLLSLVLVKFAA
jgi:hypothetical protein